MVKVKKEVMVVLIDSGIDICHDYLKKSIIGGMSLECKNDYIIESNNYDDLNGHGTSCASTIKKEFADIKIFVVRILGEDGKTNIQILEEALKFFLTKNIRLINLSLSVITKTNGMVEDLYKICENLKKQGKIIVCSLANGSKVSYPATFDNVIGVRGFILEDENSFWYNKDKNIQCIMDNNPYMNCTVNNSYKLFGKCNSQSTAKLTGRIANLLSEEPDITFDLLNKKLEDLSNKRDWTENDLLASKRYPDYKNVIYAKNNSILLNTAAIVKDVLKLDKNNNDVYEFSLFDAQIGLNNDNCFEVLKKLEEKFNIKFDYLNISRYDFVSIQTLSDLVVKTLKDSNSVNNNLAVVSELL